MQRPSREEMERARLARDGSYDGVFWVGVRSTGIFCRPSCPAKAPAERNVAYFTSVEDATRAGLRPCLRCRPTETDGRPPEWVRRLLSLVDARGSERLTEKALADAGFEPVRVRRWFRAHHGRTFQAWHRARRLGEAQAKLSEGADILDAGLDHGYSSASGFHEAFVRHFGVTPGRGDAAHRLLLRSVESPLGRLDLGATDRGICLLEFADRRALPTELRDLERHFGTPVVPGTNGHLDLLVDELARYFKGALREFTVPLDLIGTKFQVAVWQELLKLPYGTTCSYGELAARLGRPGAGRAVGSANGKNRVAIAVPCHRVVEASGHLRGYGGGLWRKRLLLDLEAGQRTLPV